MTMSLPQPQFRTCEVDCCEGIHEGYGFCRKHYKKFRRYGSAIGPFLGKGAQICKVDECSKKNDNNGYCGMHAQRFKRTGDPLGLRVNSRKAKTCEAAACDKRASHWGLCATHHRYKQETGNPNVRPPRKERGRIAAPKGQRNKYKFRHVTNHPIVGTVTILEHRLVMSEILGRVLFANENVHHINGDGKDNRPENLELWITSQPPGQRVTDKVDWAVELLERYAPERLSK